MPEQSPVAMKRGDIISDRCSSCGKPWEEHLGIQTLCATNEKLRQDLSDVRLTVSAMDMRIKDLMEEKANG